MKKLISIVLVLIMAASVAPMGSASGAKNRASASAGEIAPVNTDAVRVDESAADIDMDEIVTLMIKLKGSPAAACGSVKDAEAQEAVRAIEAEQAAFEKKLASLFPKGEGLRVNYRYKLLFNGISIDAPRGMMAKIAALDGVERVYIAPSWLAPETVKTEPDRLLDSIPFINADDVWAAGYTGKGTVIAILDTGASVAHNAFAAEPADAKLTMSDISALLAGGDLHCGELCSGVSAADLYYSGKIPFKFDYAGRDTDVSHADVGSDHGTHVAGIAAGNDAVTGRAGVAKDAQLVIMKVYGASGHTSWATVMAALEDCAALGTDAVNMSLGAGCGYTSDDPDMDEVFSLLTDLGCGISCGAGNDGSDNGAQYYGSNFSTGALAMNPDNGIISAPGTYTDAMSVACCQKNAYTLLNFSSHGSTADLKIKPEITAPGYNVISAVDPNLNGGTTGYGSSSGTSMSSPHIAGCMALITGYVNTAFPGLSGKEKIDMVNRLLMCTADPATRISPRSQGSGIVNALKAVTTAAYVTVDGSDRPKLELGDDPTRSGVYTLSFNVVNFGSAALSYTVTPTVLTERTGTGTLNGQSVNVLTGSAWNIKSYATVSGDTSVTVPANSTRRVTITITLKQNIKTELDSRFPHGIYIDGEVTLDGDVDLVVPYLAFYGNWNEASVFDRNTYIDEIQGVNNYNIHTYQAAVGASAGNGEYMLFGANPYASGSDWLSDRCTLSPNGDGYYDRIDRLTYDLIRNAGDGGLMIYNEDTGEVYLDIDLSYTPKAWNHNNGDPNAAFLHSSDRLSGLFSSWAPDGLAEGTHIVFLLYHYLDNPGFTPVQNECCEIRLPMTIDTTAPEVTVWNIAGTGSTVTVRDAHYAAWVGIYEDAACTSLIAERTLAPTERGASVTVTFNTYSDTVYVVTGDYGRNTSGVIALTGSGTAAPVDLEEMTLTPDPVEVLTGHTAVLTVNKTPAEANDYDIVWSVSDPSIAAVTGDGDSAEVVGVSAGYAVVTATATDRVTKAVITAQAAVKVTGFLGFELADSLENGEKYVVVAESSITGTDAFAAGNTPVTFGRYLLPVAVTVNADGTCTVAEADEPAILWTVSGSASAGYSFYNEAAGKYMDLDQSGYLYPGTNPLKWFYDSQHRLDNRVSSGGYYFLSYAEETSLLNPAKYTISNSSAEQSLVIRLYKLCTEEPAPVYHSVTFVDWDGRVISSQQVLEGMPAAAPADPVREGYTFTGWTPADFTHVQSDMTITAEYSINSYTLTIGYVYADGSEAAPTHTGTLEYGAAYSVESPSFLGFTADIPLVAGVMGAANVSVTVTYTRTVFVTLLGDADNNGLVDMRDVTTLNAYIMNCGDITEQGMVNADVNGDGFITAYDSTLIAMLALGISLPE